MFIIFLLANRTVADEIRDLGAKMEQIIPLTVEDLNDIKVSGTYTQAVNAGATLDKHYPVAFAGFLEVFTYSKTWIMQRYTAYNTGKAYVRIFTSSWGGWMES